MTCSPGHEPAQVGELAALVVAARVVAQQVADGVQAEPVVEHLGGLVADDGPRPGAQSDATGSLHPDEQRVARPARPS